MQTTSRASTSRSSRRSLAWAPVVAASAALLVAGACGQDDSSSVPAFNGLAPSTGVGGGAANQPGGGAPVGSAGAAGTGGAASSSDRPNGGINLAAGGTGGGGNGVVITEMLPVTEKPCVDTAPPPDPTWPDATCESWATETTECGADWFANYCDISCGRCVPEGGSALPTAPDCSGENLPNVTGGEGYATRYWDCCQTHCAQFDGHKCSQDGTTRTGDNTSSCQGGGSYACYDEAPRAVSACLSYGHIAKANPNCGGCYRIQFTGQGNYNPNDIGSTLIKGKQMIVKVTNTGSDVNGNQFDLMIPGGGVGLFNACSRQWNQSDLGAQYGGFLTDCTGTHAQKKECVRQECNKIPAGQAREGCLWFVDWLEIADGPSFTSQEVACPF
jgi:glycosyl hydrolase family 45